MQGIRDDESLGRDTTYFMIKIYKCNDARLSLKQKESFTCADQSIIDDWREDKTLNPYTIKEMPNFQRINQLLWDDQ